MADEKKIQQTSPSITLFTFFSNSSNYRIATAIRGPDFEANGLKWIFTMRIRRMVGLEFPSHSARNTREINAKDLEDAVNELLNQLPHNHFGVRHYLNHTYEAIEALRELQLFDREELDFLDDLQEFFDLLVNIAVPTPGYENLQKLYVASAEDYVRSLINSNFIRNRKRARHILTAAIKAAVMKSKEGKK